MSEKNKSKNKFLIKVTIVAWTLVAVLLVFTNWTAITARFVSLKLLVMHSKLYTSTHPLPSNKSKIIPLSKAWHSGLSTYTNKDYFLSFKYPSYLQKTEAYIPHDPYRDFYPDHYSIVLTTPQIGTLHTDDRYHNWEEANYACQNSFNLYVNVFTNIGTQSLTDFIYTGGLLGSYTVDQIKEKSIQLQKPVEKSYFFDGRFRTQEQPTEMLYFKYGKYIYEFTLEKNCGDWDVDLTPEAKQLYQNIIDSIILK